MNLKAIQVKRLKRDNLVLVVRAAVGGHSLRVPIAELKPGDTFRFKGLWFYVGDRTITHLDISDVGLARLNPIPGVLEVQKRIDYCERLQRLRLPHVKASENLRARRLVRRP